MDGNRFDDLTKQLAAGSSRRTLFKVLAGGVAAGLAALTTAGTDAAARQPNGAACTRHTDCTSLKCADGVCCDKACTGQCERCATGVCTPGVGVPVGNRPACPGSGLCALTCDGVTRTRCAGSPAPGTACGGNGACVPTTTNCSPFGCDASGTACATGCTSDAQCGAGSACVGEQCQAAQGLGAPCTAGNQCQSGVCAQGVCCIQPCDGPCVACNVAGNVGFCTPTEGVPCNDGNPCIENDVCRNNGSCQGTPISCPPRGVCETATCNPATGACDYRPAGGTVCRPAAGPCDVPDVCDGISFDCPPDQVQPVSSVCREASCVDGLAVPPTTCDGASIDCPPPSAGEPCAPSVCASETVATVSTCEAGACVTTTQDCGLYVCVDGACPTTCTEHDDCVGAAFCADGVCQGDRPLGGTCATPDECVSGRCVAGVCCDAACDGPCQTCATGICEGTTGDACGGTGVCASTCQAGTCVFPDASVSCADATCSTPTTVAVGVCDGAGGCASETTDCAPYVCAEGVCLSSCAGDGDCAGNGSCESGACQALDPNGTACADPAQCASGICAGGVCCDSDCADPCQSCATGTCTTRTSGSCGPEGVCQGTCNASGVCIFPASSVRCGVTCDDGIAWEHRCGPGGTCNRAAFDVCAPYACAGGFCRSNCNNDDDCAPGHAWEDRVCVALGVQGDFCIGDDQCQSGNCTGFTCCESACDGPCERCNGDGECLPVAGLPSGACEGHDPENAVCSGRCDGVRGDNCAALPGPEQRCQIRFCAGSTLQPARFCDGAGGCTTIVDTPQDCTPYLCNPSLLECRTSCTVDEHCIDGFHCTSAGACEVDVPLTGACEESNDCVDGLACHEIPSGDSLCCPAASCPPCQIYDGTCACVPVANDDLCFPGSLRKCCGGECCAGGLACQDGACAQACTQFGEPCISRSFCCLTDGEEPACEVGAFTDYERTCCHPVGGTCTDSPNSFTTQCCNVGEAVYCSADGICGGAGAFCDTPCYDYPDDGQQCFSGCVSGVCCGFVCCDVGEICDRTNTRNGVCRFPAGRDCTSAEDCASGFCHEGHCCDECGGACFRPRPDDTPCNGGAPGYACCAGACIVANDRDHCGGCNVSCPTGDICFEDLSCSCTIPSANGFVHYCQVSPFGVCLQSANGGLVCALSLVAINFRFQDPDIMEGCGPACSTHADCQGLPALLTDFNGMAPPSVTDDWVCADNQGCGRSCVPVFPEIEGPFAASCRGNEHCRSGLCCGGQCCRDNHTGCHQGACV